MARSDPANTPAARFCTEASRAAGEPLAGWGAHQERNVLIRWPKGRWQHSLRLAAGMEGGVDAAIERLVEAGWRVNLIDRKGEPEDGIRVFVHPGALAFDLSPDDLPGFLDAVPDGASALDRYGPAPASVPLILCCTHGRHDRCCAKFGFAVYRALAAEAAARGGFDVWESTHLGGCRLSASVLVLPSLRKYGRLSPAEVPALLEAEAAGRPYLPCYRGGSLLPPPAQAAEVAGLKALSDRGVTGPARIRETRPSTYTVTVAGRAVTVRARSVTHLGHGSCSDLDAAADPKPKTVWHAEVLPT